MNRRPRNRVRVIVPDSHGSSADPLAIKAFLGDLKSLDPTEIVMLGDHMDCNGVFNTHPRTYVADLGECYVDDAAAANEFLDRIQEICPKATIRYLEGNHEQHVERWIVRSVDHQRDAAGLLRVYGPEAVLQLQQRGIRYYLRSEHYHGLSIPGAIRLGKCFFVHGVSHSKNAAATHLARFGANVVFGHCHRSQSTMERTVTSDGFGAWCPGTLAKLQPLYMHTQPTSWSHGYGLQFVAPSGVFLHLNVPIHKGRSLLLDVAKHVA